MFMMYSYSRGHKIHYSENQKQWLYSDDNTSFDDSRPCIRCGKMSTEDGYDACLGRIENVESACCGHGVNEPILVGEN